MSSEFLFVTDILHDTEKHLAVRLTVNEFRGVEYLSLREYYEDFDSEWKPTKRGITMPLSIELINNLEEALSELKKS